MPFFFCDKCGECCRHIHLIEELRTYDRGDGQCRYLTGNLCSIYETRPDICNVEKMFQKKFSGLMSREEYIRLNHEGCKQIKQMNNLSDGDFQVQND